MWEIILYAKISRTALGPEQPPLQELLVFLPRLQIGQAVKLTNQLYRTSRFRLWKCTSIPLTCLFRPVKDVKESHTRPGVAQRVPGGLGSQISWHSAHEGGEVVSLTHRPPLPRGMFLVLIFTRGWADPWAMLRSEGNMSLKNPVTPPGMDRGTVRLVAQRLNHYATPGPFPACTGTNLLKSV